MLLPPLPLRFRPLLQLLLLLQAVAVVVAVAVPVAVVVAAAALVVAVAVVAVAVAGTVTGELSRVVSPGDGVVGGVGVALAAVLVGEGGGDAVPV